MGTGHNKNLRVMGVGVVLGAVRTVAGTEAVGRLKGRLAVRAAPAPRAEKGSRMAGGSW